MSSDMASPQMAEWLESAWLARYLDRQLSGEENAWFESYVLDKPHLLTAIETDTHLRDALAAGRSGARLTGNEPVDEAAREDGSPPETGTGARRANARAWLSKAAAFAAGLLIPGIALVHRGSIEGAGASAPVVGTVTLGATRGSESSPVHAVLPSASGMFVIEIPPGFEPAKPGETLVARMESERGQSIDVGDLAAAADGFVAFAVPVAQLSPGRWAVTLAMTHGHSAPLARYTLDLKAATP